MLDERTHILRQFGVADLLPRFHFIGAKHAEIIADKENAIDSQVAPLPTQGSDVNPSDKQTIEKGIAEKNTHPALSNNVQQLTDSLVENGIDNKTLSSEVKQSPAVNVETKKSENRQFRLRFYQLEKTLFIFSQPGLQWANVNEDKRFLADIAIAVSQTPQVSLILDEVFTWPPTPGIEAHSHEEALLEFLAFQVNQGKTELIITLGLPSSDYFCCREGSHKIKNIDLPILEASALGFYRANPDSKADLVGLLNVYAR